MELRGTLLAALLLTLVGLSVNPVHAQSPSYATEMWNAFSTQRVAPLEIRTSGESDYYIKLVDRSSGRDVLGLYISGGRSLEVTVPLGTYDIRYAIGTGWQNTQTLFGPNTSYFRADSVFQFSDQGQYYSGYTIELIEQIGGNLGKTRLNPSDF